MINVSYPNFIPLEIGQIELFRQAFKNNPPKISEFTFTNLYSWREAYKTKVSILEDFIILRSESEDRSRFFDPIGKGDKKNIIKALLNKPQASLIRIPEETAGLFRDHKGFEVKEDINNADYLYRTEDLVTLKGEKYDGKRNLIKKFRLNNTYEYATMNAGNSGECLKFEDKWCAIKNCDRVEGLSNERSAIGEMAASYSGFELIGGMIKIQGNISAISLAQRLNPDTLVMHVLKADPNVAGLYQAMLHEFLEHEAGNFNYVNLEQDLGIEGLRKSKQSYHPIEMIKKYTLSIPG